MIAFFTATIVVEFDKSDDDATAAQDALNEYIADNNIADAFELQGIQEN